jgi:hypothetical protein
MLEFPICYLRIVNIAFLFMIPQKICIENPYIYIYIYNCAILDEYKAI